jgi:hypothetical protein
MTDQGKISEDEPTTYAYRSRGMGLNWLPCFVCGHGGEGKAQADLAAFVGSKDEGEKVVEMFWAKKGHASLDYRGFEPNYVQVKVGACGVHRPNLEALHYATSEANGTISKSILDRVFPAPPADLDEALDGVAKEILQAHQMMERGLFTEEHWGGDGQAIRNAIDGAGYDIVPRGQ